MALIEQTIDIAVPREHMFQVLADVASYPTFLSDVATTQIVSQSEQTLEVEFSVKVIRRVTYSVEMIVEPPSSIRWTHKSGRSFRKNDGSWTLTEIDENNTRAVYAIDLEVYAFVPNAIVYRLISYTLPAMLQEWKSHAESTYGGTP